MDLKINIEIICIYLRKSLQIIFNTCYCQLKDTYLVSLSSRIYRLALSRDATKSRVYFMIQKFEIEYIVRFHAILYIYIFVS